MLEINNKTEYQLDKSQINHIVERFLDFYKRPNYSISLAIVETDEMKALNREFRGIDKVTDILSFENSEDKFFPQEKSSDLYLGELIICYAKIKEQSKVYSDSDEAEFFFILVHGLLHLLGYEDESEAGRVEMDKLGREFIKSLEQ